MPPKKRFNAFEDLGNEKPGPGKVKPSILNGEEDKNPIVERIERLAPSQMMPDRFQPRRLLPSTLREDFYSGRRDCYQTALEWLAMARADPGTAAEVEKLLAMGASFGEHGQIKSITGKWGSNERGDFVFQIETGERRFWAACLQHVSGNEKVEPLLRVEVVEHPTRQRQVLENRHAEPPSAVEQACEVASLILAELDLQPDPTETDDYDYFRQARTQRMPAGLWDRVIPIMQLTRPRMVQLLNILQLSTPQLDLADRYRLSERVLREILSAPREQWERMIKLSIQNQLTSEEVAEYTSTTLPVDAKPRHPAPPILPEPGRQAARSMRRFVLTMNDLDRVGRDQALDEIADTLVVKGSGASSVEIFEELIKLIRVRLDRR